MSPKSTGSSVRKTSHFLLVAMKVASKTHSTLNASHARIMELGHPVVVLSHQPHEHCCLTGAWCSMLPHSSSRCLFIRPFLRMFNEVNCNVVAVNVLSRLLSSYNRHCPRGGAPPPNSHELTVHGRCKD
jgi:hypothetical protein